MRAIIVFSMKAETHILNESRKRTFLIKKMLSPIKNIEELKNLNELVSL